MRFPHASFRRPGLLLPLTLLLASATGALHAQADSQPGSQTAPRAITTPRQQFGFSIGDDYHMANYVQETEYLKKLAGESDRMKLVEIGRTAENRPQYMAIISSPENLAKMDHYKEIAAKLARAENLTDEQAHALAEEGRAIVWIDGGLHASETVGSQQLVETIYMLNSATDPEMMRLLHDDIVLCTFANPDGMDLVADWYNREPVPEKRVTDGPTGNTPRLWQHYIGHDNNRDFYLNAMPESTNISRILFRDWYPQIIYNHHQAGPAGTVIFMPPFRDPYNYDYDPLIPTKIEAVGTAMHERLIEENKPGSTMRSGANYSTWYNGGLRTITYFHNTIGLLTEIIGSPTPMQVPLIPNRQLGSNDLPYPVPPGTWHYRQSIDYELTNNRAVMDYASREKEHLLYDTYLMGKNSIARGSKDSWTITPKRIDALEAAAAALPPAGAGAGAAGARGGRRGAAPTAQSTQMTPGMPGSDSSPAPATTGSATAPARGAEGAPVAGAGTTQSSPGGGGDATTGSGARPATPAPAASGPLPGGLGGGPAGPGSSPVPTDLYAKVLHDPALRDPRGYILPSDQPDFPTATKFVNSLIKSGVIVQQATMAFTVAGKSYPSGSYVIMAAQAYRPQVLDMFERQDHPNDFPYPGGPPNRPYDATGWTLALQMGVVYDRILDGFTGPFTPIATESTTALAKPLAGTITGAAHPRGWLVSHSYNDTFILTNRLAKAKEPVYWMKQPVSAEGKQFAAGALWIPATPGSKAIVEAAVQQLGISATGVAQAPAGERMELHPQRIALYDQYGGLMPSGWIRWLLEQFEFPFTVIYPQTLDAGGLKTKFDVILFSDGAISLGANARGGGGEGFYGRQPNPEQIPAEFRPWLGRVTQEKTIPQLQTFVQNGGTVLAIGSSSASLYQAMNLPVSNAVVEINKGVEQPVPPERFYIPGSLIKTQVDPNLPLAYGMGASADVFFDRSPAFRLAPDARQRGVETVAWYGQGKLLDSGWAWGENYLNESAAVVRVKQGKGSVVLYGPEITFRGQPHGTFKLLFNALEAGSSE